VANPIKQFEIQPLINFPVGNFDLSYTNSALWMTIAVVVSAISVIVALPYYIVIGDTINLSILLFAGPAAMIGGFIARHLAMAISPMRLKIVLSSWIIFSGFVYLFAR